MSARAPAARRFVPALDGVRALSALAVFGHHVAWLHLGDLGVDVFFVLSGFLITTRLFALRDEAPDASPSEWWRSFLVRRGARIFPLYFVTLALLATVGPALGARTEADAWPSLVTYSVNFHLFAQRHFIGAGSHFWSLAIEEQFYVLFPFLVLTRAVRRLGVAAIALVIAGVVARVALAGDGWAFALPVTHFDALGVGIAAAVCARDGAVAGVRRAPIQIAGALAGALFLAVAIASPANDVARALAPTLLSLAAAAVTLATWTGSAPRLAAVLGWHPLAALGRVSYGFYVFHLLVIEWLWRRRPPSVPDTALVALALVLSIALASISWHVLERPILRRVGRADVPPRTSRRPRADVVTP